MKDKRSNQICIPLDATPEQAKGYVMQAYHMTFAKQKKVSVVAKRIIAKVFEQIQANDHQFLPHYQIGIHEVIPPDADISSAYKAVKQATFDLQTQVWIFENGEQKEFTNQPLLYKSMYKNGMITITLNKELEPYLLNLVSAFTLYNVKYYMSLKSWYSMQMYEKLSHFKDSPEGWYTSVEEFRRQMDCDDTDDDGKYLKYPETKDLIKKTLSEPLKELESTDMAFDYEVHKANNLRGRGRKAVKGFQFKLKSVKPQTGSTLKKWTDNSQFTEEHKKVIQKLTSEWKVSVANIEKYAPAIGLKALLKVIYTWELKQLSSKRIDDKAKFCNYVIDKMGKTALAKQKNKGGEPSPSFEKNKPEPQGSPRNNEPIIEFSYLDIEKPVSSKLARNVLSENDMADWMANYEEVKEGNAFKGKTFEEFMAIQKIFKEGECWVKS